MGFFSNLFRGRDAPSNSIAEAGMDSLWGARLPGRE